MQTPKEYLEKTESAVRRLFDGIDEYLAVLRQVTGVTLITGTPYGPKQDAEFQAWQTANRQRLDDARRAEREYIAETFALDTLCGAVLQVAGRRWSCTGRTRHFPRVCPLQ